MRPPGKIVCVGRNYADHAAELGNGVPPDPLTFLKPPSAVIPAGEEVQIPPDAGRIDFEGEIGLVIGARCRRVSEAGAWERVAGVVAVNDVTARDIQRQDSQWTRAKGLDTFCPVGNAVAAHSVEWESLEIVTRLNGEVRQQASASAMVFSIPFLISHISHLMTLEEGDLIATGTPAGVGPLAVGDLVEVELSCGSRVHNPVQEALPLGVARPAL